MIGYNSVTKAALIPYIQNYLSLQWSSYSVIDKADAFYRKIKGKSTEVLEKYSTLIEPRGFIDIVKFLFNGQRKARFAAVGRILTERKIISHLEKKLF